MGVVSSIVVAISDTSEISENIIHVLHNRHSCGGRNLISNISYFSYLFGEDLSEGIVGVGFYGSVLVGGAREMAESVVGVVSDVAFCICLFY